MIELQLEFNIDNKSPEEIRFSLMEKQLGQMSESMGKVRRCLFAEVGQMKKLYIELQKENLELKAIVKELKNERQEWVYGQEGCLFELQEAQIAVG